MPSEDIPPLTPDDEKNIKAMIDAIPWAAGVDPDPVPTEEELALDALVGRGNRTIAHAVVENEWRDRIAAALKRAGYTDVRTEHPVPGGRVDITFSWHAIEIDWASKWAESLGQALYYSLCLASKAVALLLVEGPVGMVQVERARKVARNNTPPLQVWVFDVKTKVLDIDGGRSINVD